MATAQRDLSNIWNDSLPFPLKAQTVSETLTSCDSLPRECDFHRDRSHPHGQMSWYEVRIFEAEAKQGPFRNTDLCRSSCLLAHSYFHRSARGWSFGNKPDVLGVSVQTRRYLGVGGSSERKQFSSFPWLLSVSVHLHHVWAWDATLFSSLGSKAVL